MSRDELCVDDIMTDFNSYSLPIGQLYRFFVLKLAKRIPQAGTHIFS